MTYQSELLLAFRDYATDGVASSGAHEPVKAEIRKALGYTLISQLDSLALALLTNNLEVYPTVAAMNADLVPADDTYAIILSTSDTDFLKIYIKNGATGVGTWDLVNQIPNDLTTVLGDIATLTGVINRRIMLVTSPGGTGTAYTGTTVAQPEAGDIVAIIPTVDNTGSLTLALNGGTQRSVRDANGAQLTDPSMTVASRIAFLEFQADNTYRHLNGRVIKPRLKDSSQKDDVWARPQGMELERRLRDMMTGQTVDEFGIIPLATADAWVMSANDKFRPIYATHASAKLDAQYMMIGTNNFIFIPAGGGLTIYVGADPTWATFLPAGTFGTSTDNSLVLSGGSAYNIHKINSLLYVVVQHGGTAYTTSNTDPAVRDLSFTVALDQSLGERLFTTGGMRGFQKELAANAIVKDVWPLNGASGASSLFERDAGGVAGNYWVESTSGAAPYSAGPLMTTFLSLVAAAVALGQPHPTLIFAGLGQTDAVFIDDYWTAAEVMAGWEWAIDHIRDNISTPNPNLPFALSVVNGDNYGSGGTDAQFSTIRQIQLDLIRTVPNVYMGPQTYDLPTPINDLHPTIYGSELHGKRAARVWVNLMEAGSVSEGPRIIDVTKTSDTQYDVEIEADSAIEKPDFPDGFAFIPSAATDMGTAVPEFPVRFEWAVSGGGNNLLRCFLAVGEAGTMKLMYPYGNLRRLWGSKNFVRDLVLDELPLQPYWPGF